MEEEDFQVISNDGPPRSGANGTSGAKKKFQFSNLYTNGKYKLMASLYNIIHSYPTELPPFSDSPIYMMGICYANDQDNLVHKSQSSPTLDRLEGKTQVENNNNNTSTTFIRRSLEESKERFWKRKKQLAESPPSRTFFSNSTSVPKSNSPKPELNIPKFIQDFLEDFGSLLCFCYRKDFPPLQNSELTTDIGWGCMLRSGQMMLAAVLIRHFLGRDWRVNARDQLSPYSPYRQILRWFTDSPSSKCPYSIHNLVRGSDVIDSANSDDAQTVNKVGEWFTPTRVGQILRELVQAHCPNLLTMHLAQDGVIYRKSIIELCKIDATTPTPETQNENNINNNNNIPSTINETTNAPHPTPENSPYNTPTSLPTESSPKVTPIDQQTDKDSTWKPVFILVPLRLGLDALNKVYFDSVKAVLQFPQSVGIIGGRPRQSLYFVGYQDDDLFFLDPHFVKPAVKSEQEFSLDTYHCAIPQRMPLANVDPTLAIGFYCQDENDFDDLCIRVIQFNAEHTPMFSIEETAPNYEEDEFSGEKLVL